MNLDEAVAAWRSQDAAPLYEVDRDRLREALAQEERTRRRRLLREARVVYAGSTMMFAFLALLFVGMFYDDDPRTIWDFVIAVMGAAAALLWGAHLYIARKKLALRERKFGASLHDEIERHLALLDYELSQTWRPSGVAPTVLAVSVTAVATILAGWRINNEPFSWWTVGIPILTVVASMAHFTWDARRKAERDVVPRRRRLEALLEQLKEL